MPFFILPQGWITPAIAAAAMAFGSIDEPVSIKYYAFSAKGSQAVAQPPSTIWVDKRKKWDKRQAQCLLVHEYGHLAGKQHPKSKNSIMSEVVSYKVCVRWLRKHGVSPNHSK